jgi:hypothetical protein
VGTHLAALPAIPGTTVKQDTRNYIKDLNKSYKSNEERFAIGNDRIGSDRLAGFKFLT